ncbi:MAG: hypothetical protein IPG59_23085 [Candidatus Melainabacteria bacterium]|nr:MAG: hypothetical protein IPG59_23085 [Candidatus Melainabacteria bacterium]
MSSPIICFGQQPCGFFPKRFLVAKITAARKLQAQIGGEIVFFYHDSDHDPRETRTILRHRTTNEEAKLNFTFENKTQRKFSPLYLKRIESGWHEKTILQLPNYLDHPQIDLFKSVTTNIVSDFCLEMYRLMGFLNGIKVLKSSSAEFRREACDIKEFYVDIEHDGEIVRARFAGDHFTLHEGGDKFLKLPMTTYSKEQISPTRDSRLGWMQSVIKCTHYVSGAGEQNYIRKQDAPEIEYVTRDEIDRVDEAYTNLDGAQNG